MTINRRICPSGLKNNPNKNLASISFITVHCTGNYAATATAKNHADYIYGGSGGNQTSWHYTIDAKEIYQHFEDKQETWHAGDGTNGPGNSTSIGLEICVNDKANFRQACDNATWLTAELLKRHNLTIDKVVQHNRWSGKDCPQELRNGAWGVTWSEFLEMVKKHLAPVLLAREECRVVIQSKCQFSDPAGVWTAIETHRFADDLYRRLASVMR